MTGRRFGCQLGNYDGEFRYGQRPIDALQSIDTDGRVIYLGTFSKALSPQLRLGYLVLPPELVPVFRQAKRLADRHAPVLAQRALASLIDSGAYERHVRRMRRENDRRCTALLDAIARHLPGDVRVSGTAAGLHRVLWLPFLRSQDEPALVAAARNKDVGIYPVTPLFANPDSSMQPRPAGVILGYASLRTDQIEQGIRTAGSGDCGNRARIIWPIAHAFLRDRLGGASNGFWVIRRLSRYGSMHAEIRLPIH